MKDLSLLAWLTQLGLSVSVPPTVFILLAIWLRDRFALGQWVLWVGIVLGIYCAVTGFISSLRILSQMTREKDPDTKTVSFHEHE
jgi:hypothetical protein